MSVVINYVSEYLSIIATDTRVSYGRNCEFGYNDDEKKLINLKNMGWSAGVGLANFLNKFKLELANSDVNVSGEIEEIFSRTLDESIREQPYFAEDINKSVVSFSWIGTDQGNIFCRLGIVSKENFNSQIKVLGNENILILYPPEFLENHDLAFDLEERHGTVQTFDGSLEKILEKIFGIFLEISKTSKSVSSICELGILCILQDGVYKGKISGDINVLQTDLQYENIRGEWERIITFRSKE